MLPMNGVRKILPPEVNAKKCMKPACNCPRKCIDKVNEIFNAAKER